MDELLGRIRKLEELLHRHIETSPPSVLPEHQVATPVTNPTTSEIMPQNRFGDTSTTSSPSHVSLQSPGVLRISSSGYQRYEPRSSQWSSVIPDETGQFLGDINIQEHSELVGFPFEANAALDRKNLLACLPPVRQCEELLDVFFEVFSPVCLSQPQSHSSISIANVPFQLFHILHDLTFRDEYIRFRQNPGAVSLSWLALLFVILAIAVTALDDDNHLLDDLGHEATAAANIRTLTSRYRAASFHCLAADQFLWQHNLYTLQALVFLIYALNHSHGQSWPLLGLTHNIALALGCHVDPDNFEMSILDREQRRRCWAGLMMMYTIQNTALGNLDPQPPINRVRLPANVNDDDLTDGHVPACHGGPTQMSYILYKFRLYNIASKICKVAFAGISMPSREAVLALDRKIIAEQEEWNERFLATPASSTHHLVHLKILYSYSHQLTLVLHRPFFATNRGWKTIDGAKESRVRCIASARSLLEIHKELFETPEFKPYQWYNRGLGSFHAFHGAVVLATVMLHPEAGEDTLGIWDALQGCLARFEALSARSNICTKGISVLRALLYV